MLLSVLCGGLERAVTSVHLSGENEVACMHAIQPDSKIKTCLFFWDFFVCLYYYYYWVVLGFFFSIFECMSV